MRFLVFRMLPRTTVACNALNTDLICSGFQAGFSAPSGWSVSNTFLIAASTAA